MQIENEKRERKKCKGILIFTEGRFKAARQCLWEKRLKHPLLILAYHSSVPDTVSLSSFFFYGQTS